MTTTKIFSTDNNLVLIAYPTAEFFVKEFAKFGYDLTMYTNVKGPSARAIYKTARMKYVKTAFGFYFGTKARRAEYLLEKLAELQNIAKREQEQKAALAAAKADFVNPFKVGQLFYDSWGYDQTNIDYYEITEVKAKSVMLARIESEHCGDSRVKPAAGQFKGQPVLKTVQVRFYNGQANYYINGDRGSISPYTAGNNGLVYSNYH